MNRSYVGPMALLKMYLRTESEVFRSRFSDVRAQTTRETGRINTDARDRRHYQAAFAGGSKYVIMTMMSVMKWSCSRA